ncbi:OmpA family protein [Ruegeria sp. HKCCC2117]|uniref:OmpA family protein n=1 Tax=Ruegeria sp. HKCCC2117 TaxID=2682992 RepID=UPI001C2B8BD1
MKAYFSLTHGRSKRRYRSCRNTSQRSKNTLQSHPERRIPTNLPKTEWDDAPTTANGITGATTASVLGNDTLNGSVLNPADVLLGTSGTAKDDVTTLGLDVTPVAGSVTMNAAGEIIVAPGTYVFTYEICETLNPTNCDTAQATVVVDAAVIDAVDDASTAVNGITRTTTASVLGNDMLNGSVLNPADISLGTSGTANDGVTTLGLDMTPAAGSVTMNAAGEIVVAPGTSAGTYVFTYEICETLNPTNCDTARISVEVSNPSLIDEIAEDLIAVLEDDRDTTVELQSQQARDFATGALDRLRQRSARQCAAAVNDHLNDRPILFDTDKALIKPESDPILDEIAEILGSCEGSAFEIAGHTDSDAPDAYNLSLSQRRVDAVLQALKGRGVDTVGYRAHGYGESRPIDTNATAQGKARNRRVEFVPIEAQEQYDTCKNTRDRDHTFNLQANGSDVTIDGGLFHQNYNCARDIWETIEGSLNFLETDSGLSQTLLNLSYRRERIVSDNRVHGYFVGIYGSTGDVTSRANGEIQGFGINAGVFGANRFNNGLYLDYYLGGAVGRHEFDLDFQRSFGTIAASGDYRYFAGFAGVALSGEIEREVYRFVPRAGIDYAYSPSVDVDVVARFQSISESGLVELASLTNTRLFAELRIEREVNSGASLLAFTPVVACYASSGNFDNACNIGAELEYESFNETANGWQHGVRISGERGDGFTALSVAADVSRRLHVGQVSARAGVDAAGYLSLGGEYELKF